MGFGVPKPKTLKLGFRVEGLGRLVRQHEAPITGLAPQTRLLAKMHLRTETQIGSLQFAVGLRQGVVGKIVLLLTCDMFVESGVEVRHGGCVEHVRTQGVVTAGSLAFCPSSKYATF